jgi:predicted metal-dependent peptidase
MTPQLADLLSLARFQASRSVPYLARGLWACSYVESSDVETFAIDSKWRVLVNPTFAVKCAADGSLPAALVHEALHQILRHGPRAKTIGADDHPRWNCSGDCEINARIDEVKVLKLPSCGVRAATFGWAPSLAAEEYYSQPSNPRKGPEPGCSGGSGAGAPHDAESELPAAGLGGPPGLSEGEGDLVRVAVAQATIEAAKTKPGSVGAGMLRWAESMGDAPTIDWRAMVQARIVYATQAKRGPTPSYARPSRRGMGCAMILPVYRAPVPRVSLVLDTSGSMRGGDIGTALAVVVDACLALGHVQAVACDAEAGDVVDVRHVDDLRDYLRGGGGTNMVAGIARAEETSPDAIVVVTDGETGWPNEEPACPVIVVLTREPSYCGRPPTWAEVIQAY